MTYSFVKPPIISAILAIASLLLNPTGASRIVPLHTSVNFPFAVSTNRWSTLVRSPQGSAAYVLSLEPDFDVGKHPVTLTLVLRHEGDGNDAPNLLDPTGTRHGLQSYDFAADDLAKGVEKSAFGRRRTVAIKDLGLVLRVEIINATVSPISNHEFQLDGLGLKIDLNNSTP